MKLSSWLAMSVSCFLFAACSPINSVQPFSPSQAEALVNQGSTPRPAKQMVALNLPRHQQWQKVNEYADRTSSPVMLVPENQSVVNWQESIKTRIRFYSANFTAKDVVQNQISLAKTNCQTVDTKILAETPQAITYRLTKHSCTNRDDRLQVGKAFNGVDAIYLIYYSAVSNDVPTKQENLMAHVIANARLVSNPSYH